MVATQVLNEVVTLGEAEELAQQMGHPLDRANLMRYVQAGRLAARKSRGTWLTTRSEVRTLVVSLEAETRGRPRPIKVRKIAASYRRTPELIRSLKRIQSARQALRTQSLPADRQAKLWDDLTTEAIYHTNRLEGNPLTFEEARAVIESYRQTKTDSA